jgi:maltose-binding protein MalE
MVKGNIRNLSLLVINCGALLLSLVSCGQSVEDEYVFTYDLNYTGSTPRIVAILNGDTAPDWTPLRDGYSIKDWYLDKGGNESYDFSTPVTRDMTIYAGWYSDDEIAPYSVVFDYNFDGARSPYTMSVERNTAIDSADIPAVTRLGYQVEGWYKDQSLTDRFDFSTLVNSDMTLYAKYKNIANFTYDEEENIVYDNVEFNISLLNTRNGTYNALTRMITKFNYLYKGKIKVNVVSENDENHDIFTLKYQQTERTNNTNNNFYPMQQALDLAGLSFEKDDYYSGAITDNYLDGALFTMPMIAEFPVIFYNANLIDEYNDGVLPTTRDEFIFLIEKVNDAKKDDSEWLGGIGVDQDWMMKEIASSSTYYQNGTALYDSDYRNTWLDSNEEKEKAYNALNSFATYFGNDGLGFMSGNDDTVYNSIKNEDSIFVLAGNPWVNSYYSGYLGSSIGVMSAEKLFAVDPNVEYADDIFVKNISLCLNAQGPNDLYKIAAAAVFADWASKNTAPFASAYSYPLNKKVMESEAVTSLKNLSYNYFLKNAGNPEKFITLPAHEQESTIFININNYLLTSVAGHSDEASLNDLIEEYSELLNSTLGV